MAEGKAVVVHRAVTNRVGEGRVAVRRVAETRAVERTILDGRHVVS